MSTELAEFPDEGGPVRDALWYCDMTTTPDGDPCGFDERVDEIRARYGPEHVVARFITQAKNEIGAAVERTQRRLASAGLTVGERQ
ncbi:hypothetical protein [Streptoalloteichus tenebrarius]|uniref:hypothetical protein n=1 Tax=Streptoalloteichus tenebrarius (strain ATCC 17920 / DSM 40477 / JCM 4838 / CBS 697.72 / NBRC 16177 / NCIMB 11028 / NRRL B-12390 / A12253. 1 / ISP 5477) TaxID=1933 RepID=UPI0020A3D85D|nr:hypothetical protein [Streptoalloteichus tenebrarius]